MLFKKSLLLGTILFLSQCTQNSQTIVEITFDKMNISVARCFILTRPEGRFRETVHDFESLKDFLEKYYQDKQSLDQILPLIERIETSKQTYLKKERKQLLPISKDYVTQHILNYLDDTTIGKNVPLQEQACHSLAQLQQHLLNLTQHASDRPNHSYYFEYYLVLIVLVIVMTITVFLTPTTRAILIDYRDKIYLLIKKSMKKPTHPIAHSSSSSIEEPVQSTQNTINSVGTHPPPPGWLVVGASAIGKTHVLQHLPCQDSYAYTDIDNQWGIVVLADGAGSARYSELGAKFVTTEILHRLKDNPPIISWINKWHDFRQTPSSRHWHILVKQQLKIVKKTLEELITKKFGSDSKHFACTVIVVIYTQQGLLVTHIGDGRAAYCNEQGEWKAMFTPWKGEEANSTVFITSEIWDAQIDQFIESQVINERPVAFAVMSDGCEKHSFECSQLDPETQQWSDPNKPYEKFFRPLINKLAEMKQQGISKAEIELRWKAFLEQGTPGLKEEADDKTMIIGIWN